MASAEMKTITKDGVMAVITAASEDADALKMVYSSESKLEVGFATQVTLPGGHNMTIDEPETMPGGLNKGPNPLDVMAGALGTCQEITYKMYATVMGLNVKSVSCKVDGDIDLRGLVGLADTCAFDSINATVTIDSDATDEQLTQLKQAVDAHCPMVETLTKEVPVTTTVTQVENAAEERLKSDPVTAEGLMAVINAGKEDENALKNVYTATSKLEQDALNTVCEMQLGHKLTIDEPETMPGGNNLGPNPLDLFCASFGTCQEITYKMYGTVMNIPVNSVSCKVTGPCDLRGLVGLGEKMGFDSINGEITVDSPASAEQIATLKAAVDGHCPMADTLQKQVPLTISLKRAGEEGSISSASWNQQLKQAPDLNSMYEKK